MDCHNPLSPCNKQPPALSGLKAPPHISMASGCRGLGIGGGLGWAAVALALCRGLGETLPRASTERAALCPRCPGLHVGSWASSQHGGLRAVSSSSHPRAKIPARKADSGAEGVTSATPPLSLSECVRSGRRRQLSLGHTADSGRIGVFWKQISR